MGLAVDNVFDNNKEMYLPTFVLPSVNRQTSHCFASLSQTMLCISWLKLMMVRNAMASDDLNKISLSGVYFILLFVFLCQFVIYLFLFLLSSAGNQYRF